MRIPKILSIILVLFMIIGFSHATSDRVNNLMLGKTFSDVIYDVSEDIIENRSEIIIINVTQSSQPFVVKFISSDYATANNITCDDENCTLFGRYDYPDKYIYILPETIDNYYNYSEINQTLEKISNTFIHELSHHYQYTYLGFIHDMVDSLGMDVTYQSGTTYILHNYADYWNYNLSDIPDSIDQTVDFPNALNHYVSGNYVKEIQVRLTALCFQEKRGYDYYWDMIEIKDYQVCEQYDFPLYLDNRLAGDVEDFIEAYVTDYLNISIYELQFDKTLTDITYDIYELYMETGKDYSFVTYDDLGFLFTDESFFDSPSEGNTSVFGSYLINENVIAINLDAITEILQNHTEEETRLKIENTLKHEIGHYIDENNLINGFRTSFNVVEINETVQDLTYFLLLYNNEFITNLTPSDIPPVLEESIDFVSIYAGDAYLESKYAEEFTVRLFALCVQEKDFYSGYSQMYERSEYELCQNFSINYMSQVNAIGKDIIEGYLFEFEPDLLPPSTKAKFELAGVTNDGLSSVGILMDRTAQLLMVSILPLSIMFGFVFLVISLMRIFHFSISEFIFGLFKKK